MNSITISIPTVNNNKRGFEKLFELWNQIKEIPKNSIVIFDFKNCYNIEPNGIAFISGFIKFLEYHGCKTSIKQKINIKPIPLRQLQESDFFYKFGNESQVNNTGNTIPLREDSKEDIASIIKYLKRALLNRKHISFSEKLGNAMIGKLWEIYTNAFEHSISPVGVFTCGKYYPKKRDLRIMLVDFGIGIPKNVFDYFDVEAENANFNDCACIEWAFQSGYSTKGHERGLGLSLLLDFIQVNKGMLEIYSNKGYNCYQGEKTVYRMEKTSFNGTAIYITLKCKDIRYIFKNELKGGQSGN